MTQRLIEVFPFLAFRVDRDCADILLRVAFYEKGFQFHRKIYGSVEPTATFTFDELNPMQQHILQLLVAKETLWKEPPWMQSLGSLCSSKPVRMEGLAHLRLPCTFQELQAFIESSDR